MSLFRSLLEIVESIIAAVAIGLIVVFSPALSRWYRRWGATREEWHHGLPGDEIVPEPRLSSTRAITIAAPTADVWSWVAQLGQGRGGWYSYEKLENLVGCKIHNADRILTEHQNPQVGEKIRLAPSGSPYFVVEQIEPGRTLVLGSRNPKTDQPDDFSWTFAVRDTGRQSSRLIIRSRNYYERGFLNSLLWRVVVEPIQFVMERKMLKGIRKRAEATVRR